VDAQPMGYQTIAPGSVCKENPKYHPCGFCLSSIQNDLHMIAESTTEMQKWIEAINTQIKAVQQNKTKW
jgi:hypothetical protein